MKKVFLLFFFVLVYFCSFSQTNSLVLTKKAKDKQKIIEEGNSLFVETYSDKKFSGDFSISSDSNLVIAGDTILLSEIENIKYKSKSGKILGIVVTSIGSILFIFGALLFVFMIIEGGLAAAIIAVLLAIPSAIIGILVFFGGLILFKKGKKYKSSKWNYKIRKK